MLALRFLRTGKKNQPFFRLVVTNKKNPPRGGRFLEILGTFNPLTKEKKIKTERVKYWLGVGAKASETVHNFLIKEGVVQGKKFDVHKRPKQKEAASPAGEPVPTPTPVSVPESPVSASAETKKEDEIKTAA